MNILATINTGNFTCQNVRDSFLDAAKRWGCEYIEITEPFAKADHPYAMKLELPLYNWPENARVFFAEGDILIRDDCPSPFDVVEPGRFGVVNNDQGELDGHAQNCQRAAWESINRAFRDLWGKPSLPYTGAYWNTGAFMFEPAKHAQAFAWSAELYEALKPYGADDQTILSMALQNFRVPLRVLDRRWNCIGPIVWQSAPRLPAWITHYAKYAHHRRGRDDLLKSANWKPYPDMPPDGTKMQSPPFPKNAWAAEVINRRWVYWEIDRPERREISHHQQGLTDDYWKMQRPITDPPMLNERNGVGELSSLIGG